MAGGLVRASLRPAFVFFALLGLLVGWSLMHLFSDPEVFGPLPVGSEVLALLIFPALAGTLFGQVVQELQHTTFVWPLPGIRGRLATAFLSAGIVVSVLVFLLAISPETTPPLALLGLAFAAFCLGGIFPDPLSSKASFVTGGLAVSMLFFVEELLAIADHQPWALWAATPLIAWISTRRLFSASTFRRKPSVPTHAMLSSLWPEQVQRFEREKLLWRKARPGRSLEPLGKSVYRWVKAAVLESWGGAGALRITTETTRISMIVIALIGLGSWIDRGDLSLLRKIATDLHFVFLRPPDMTPPPGEPLLIMVPLIVGILGVVLATRWPISLHPGRLYPISRKRQGKVAYLGALVTSLAFLVAFGVGWALLAWLAGAAIGLVTEIDFLPHVLRCAALTVILLPFAQLVRLRQVRLLLEGPEAILKDIGRLLAYGFAISVLAHLFLNLFTTPSRELLTMAVLFAFSQTWFKGAVSRHFEHEDLT